MRLRFGRAINPDKIRLKASDRLSRLSTNEVLDWADATMSGCWRMLEDYRKDPTSVDLNELEVGLHTLLGAVDVLRNR